MTAAPRALILAAGRGRRIGGEDHKALTRFAGCSLVARHLDLLEAVGVRDATVVVGHQADRLRDAVAGRARTVFNPDFEQGSVVSLWAGRDVLHACAAGGAPVLLMDADVLYDARLLRRLLGSRHEGALLLDRDIEPGEEPVKVCVGGDGRITDFRKRPEHPGEWHGESVGFFRFLPGIAGELAARTEEYVAAGRRAEEYEEAIRDLILAHPGRFGYEDVTGLPWIEIDFPEDVTRAHALVPLLLAEEHAQA